MNSEELTRQWLLQNKKICICNGIPRKLFIEAIRNGARSLQEINRFVGSGSGECKGKRCGPRIERLLAAYLEEEQNRSD